MGNNDTEELQDENQVLKNESEARQNDVKMIGNNNLTMSTITKSSNTWTSSGVLPTSFAISYW